MLCRQRNKSVFLVAVRFLSNLFTRTASNYSAPRLAVATPEQMHSAMELLLLTPHQRAGAEEIDAFTQSLRVRGIDIFNTRIAARGDRLTYALLPAVLPGRTLMLISGSPAERASHADAALLIKSVTDEYLASDLSMMQVLVDPEDAISLANYAGCGFVRMAELIYLEGPTRLATYEFPAGVTLESYSAELHEDFALAIRSSYEETLDCPALNGVRTIKDIMAGHRAAGEYNPNNWLLLRDAGVPAGVMILSKTPDSFVMEVVYVGLAPRARGRGLGIRLMLLAITRAYEARCQRLMVAVDAQNTPALNMYFRAGMQRIGSRMAMVRVMQAADDMSSTIHPQSDK